MKKENKHIGSSFQDWLESEGIREEANTAAVKAVLAYQLARTMEEKGFTKAQLARELGTSRSQVDRILDPMNDSVALSTLARAAALVGRKLRLELA